MRETLREMQSMVLDAVKYPSIKSIAVGLTSGVKANDFEGYYKRLYERLRGSYRYVPDTFGVEEIWKPEAHAGRYMRFAYTWGDCDDLAVWSASLARAIGLPVRFVAVSTGKKGKRLDHVRAEAFVKNGNGGSWRSFDFLAPNTPVLRAIHWRI